MNISSENRKTYSDEKKKNFATDTSFLVELLANSEKLIPSDQREHYDKEKDNHVDKLDDDIDNYRNNDKKDSKIYSDHKKYSDHNHYSDEKLKHNDTYSDKNDKYSDKKNYSDEKPKKDTMTPEDLELKKLNMLRKLGELKSYGVTLSKNYSMVDDLKMMEIEYNLHTGIKAKKNWIDWVSGGMVWGVQGLEVLNDNYNPFDVKLKGWHDNVNDNLNTYYDVLGEIYEDYNQPGKKMDPLLKLGLLLLGSAGKVVMQRGYIKSIESKADKLDDDSELINNLRKQAHDDTIKSKNPLNDKMFKEHDEATQRIKDLQMLREQKLEHERMKDILDAENDDLKKFKQDLLLSADTARESVKKENNSISSSSNRVSRVTNTIPNIFTQIPQQYLIPNIQPMNNYNNQQLNAFANLEAEQLKQQKKKLEKIINKISSNDDSIKSETTSSNSSQSSKSSKSKITFNKDINKILENSSESSIKISNKKMFLKGNK